jgi:hypothetical protein
MGWTSGLYMINGVVSRLTVREVARLMQVEDSVQLDEVTSVALRQLGNTTPVGMVHSLGASVEECLASASAAGEHPQWAAHQRARASAGRPRTLTQIDQAAGTARHDAKMVAWQAASAAAHASAEVSRWVGISEDPSGHAMARYWSLSDVERGQVQQGLRELGRRRWFQLKRRRGEREVQALVAAGVDAEIVLRARQTIDKALWLEQQRRGKEDGPINLLW